MSSTSKTYTYNYDSSFWPDYQTGNSLEWTMTNGIGGYAGGSLIGGLSRTHQGYLIASLHAPTERYVLLEQINEWVQIEGQEYDLETSQHLENGRTTYKEGYKYLTSVSYNGTITFKYSINHLNIIKTIALKRDSNTVVIDYLIKNGSLEEARLVLSPWFNYREHGTLLKADELAFDTLITGDTLSLVPAANPNLRIDFSVSEGSYYENENKIDQDSQLQVEVDLETEGLSSHYTPYDVALTIPSHNTRHVSVVCNVVTSNDLSGQALLEAASDCMVAPDTASRIIEAVNEYYDGLTELAASDDDLVKQLVLDADHFIAYRQSTGRKTILAGLPWFTDWGRDTMIAFTGLTLCTRRYDDALEILETFTEYLHHGMIPNMFPDDGAEPLYNTVDASLWFFYAAFKFLIYTENDSLLKADEKKLYFDFIRDRIYPVLEEIISAYSNGTDYSIYMLDNGLLHAGSDLDQITWMDVRVGDMVVTPRHGCPIEINALWYNALCIISYLADRFTNAGSPDNNKRYAIAGMRYGELTLKVRNSIYECFWNPKLQYFNDVVDGDKVDTSFRPNQVMALALPFSNIMLPDVYKKAIVDASMEKLYIGTGLRSLSPDHPDYHGQYRGALEKRDQAYHQGTAWGFLLGSMVTAYHSAYSKAPDIKDRLRNIIDPAVRHLTYANCIGGMCEVFEGDEPHTGRGCYTQAWSIGELLRAYKEDIL